MGGILSEDFVKRIVKQRVFSAKDLDWQAWKDLAQEMGRSHEALRAKAGRLEGLPTIVCLCGSTKFKDAFREAEEAITDEGKIFLTVGVFHHADGVLVTEEEKEALDRLHRHKIRLADEVFVLNVGGYIGKSTTAEIVYARSLGKPVQYLEKVCEVER